LRNYFTVLDSHIGAIYGDSINYDRAKRIFERLEDKGFASTNVVLGIGSFSNYGYP
jgi:nicotinamide phosphoribosyltransferase